MNLNPRELEALVNFLATTGNAFAAHCAEFGVDSGQLVNKLLVAHREILGGQPENAPR
jgi:hypothetical protein